MCCGWVRCTRNLPHKGVYNGTRLIVTELVCSSDTGAVAMLTCCYYDGCVSSRASSLFPVFRVDVSCRRRCAAASVRVSRPVAVPLRSDGVLHNVDFHRVWQDSQEGLTFAWRRLQFPVMPCFGTRPLLHCGRSPFDWAGVELQSVFFRHDYQQVSGPDLPLSGWGRPHVSRVDSRVVVCGFGARYYSCEPSCVDAGGWDEGGECTCALRFVGGCTVGCCTVAVWWCGPDHLTVCGWRRSCTRMCGLLGVCECGRRINQLCMLGPCS